MKSWWRTIAIVVVASAWMGCVEDLKPSVVIERARVVGTKTEVVSDPTRAWPTVGETTRITWMVASPVGSTSSLRWQFAACPAAPVTSGFDFCNGSPFSFASGEGDEPVMLLEDWAVSPLSQVLVFGAFCENGTVSLEQAERSGQLDPNAVCRSDMGADAIATVVKFRLRVQDDSVINRNPTLLDDEFFLNDAPWPAAADGLPVEGCAGASSEALLPLVVDPLADDPTIRIVLRPDDRDEISSGAGEDPAIFEDLQVSHFSTAGKLERQFSVVEGEDPEDPLEMSVEWRPPPLDRIPDDGLLVRFYFVLRDLRGGADWSTRALCVTK